MARHDLPQPALHIYPSVTIDLDQCLAIRPSREWTPLAGQRYELLSLLLRHPGRFHSYRLLAQELFPEFGGRSNRRWDDLNHREQEAIKHALQTLVYHTRLALGERSGTRSILMNRAGIGYAIRHPLRVIDSLDPDFGTLPPASA